MEHVQFVTVRRRRRRRRMRRTDDGFGRSLIALVHLSRFAHLWTTCKAELGQVSAI